MIVDFYQTVGYLPEAIINYLALLGWSLDDRSEHFSRAELIAKFSLERVNKAPASFDPKKLMAFEDWHFQLLSPQQKAGVGRAVSRKGQACGFPANERPTSERREGGGRGRRPDQSGRRHPGRSLTSSRATTN